MAKSADIGEIYRFCKSMWKNNKYALKNRLEYLNDILGTWSYDSNKSGMIYVLEMLYQFFYNEH